MVGKQKYSAQQVAKAITKHHGLLTLAAIDLGCHPDTIRNYIKRYATVKKAFDETRETLKDTIVENWVVLLANREHKDHWEAVKYGLRTYCADRGLSDRALLGRSVADEAMRYLDLVDSARTNAEDLSE